MRIVKWFVNKLNARYLSSLLLTLVLGLIFWLRPGLSPEMFGATTPEQVALLMTGIFLVFWMYLVMQGYAVSHGDIGSSSSHTTDNMVSIVPAFAAVIAGFLTLTDMHPLSTLNRVIAGLTLAVVFYDLWIIGGAASKINRLTDEIKSEK